MTVFKAILREINNNVSFVFPSEIAAMIWARKICGTEGVRSVASNRFMAWDRFKEEAVRTEVKNKRPVSALIRKLFARSLMRENAASPFLASIIPPEFADNGEAFTASLASALPSLAYWEEKRSGGFIDGEDRDLFTVKIRYAAFLERSGLFEPSWEKAAPFHGKRYIIFFPEVLADFPEYETILDCPEITLFRVQSGEKAKLHFFASARDEIREAVLLIRRLHGEGIPWNDMAVSLPGFASAAPYLVRELSLYDIPYTERAGKNLGEYGIGRLFSLIHQCASSSFSFDSLKPLLLDPFIPWKDPSLNRDLAGFGINNHCVSPFTGKNRETVDVWEEAFKNAGGVELENYYGVLKKCISGIARSKTFSEIRDRYFAFRELLDMEKCSRESDAVLARCIEELSVLMELEEDFRELSGGDPFAFYISHLNNKNYVLVHENAGVHIYDYPVAAGAPFAYSFVLNASQDAATVQRRQLAFLRQDKRRALELEDRDISAPLFRSFYTEAANGVYFSASEKSFSGWAIPHGFFEQITRGTETSAGNFNDHFTAEKNWWAGTGAFPKELFPLQKTGFTRWSKTLLGAKEGFAYLRDPVDSPELKTLLEGRISLIKGGGDRALSVSAADLTDFFSCPVSWLFRRIFRLERFSPDAALLDDASLGDIYHKLLCRLFARIKENGGVFRPELLDNYREWTMELSRSVFKDDREFRGLLAYPLLDSLSSAVAKRVCALLKTEAKYFAGFAVDILEEKLFLDRGNIIFTGMIDRVSLSRDGAFIIDYKTGAVPQREKCMLGKSFTNFQIPMYIKLYEETKKQPVSGAYFFSVNRNEIRQIVGVLPRKRGSNREKYQETVDALDEYADRFRSSLLALDFSPGAVPYGECALCSYKTICRSRYSLDADPRGKHRAEIFENSLSEEDEREEDDVFLS